MIRTTHRLAAVCIAVVLSCTAACSSSPSGGASPTPSPPSSDPGTSSAAETVAPVDSAAATADGDAGSQAASVRYYDDAGDSVAVTITVGPATAADSVSEPPVQACASELQDNGSSAPRSAAIPVTVTARLESDSPVPMTMDLLSGLSEAFQGRALQVFTGELLSPQAQQVMVDTAQDAVPMFWATSYSGTGPECTQASDGDGGSWASTTWNNLTPGTTNTWQSWLIIPEQVTPNAPDLSSPDSQANWFLFQPIVTIGQTQATTAYAAPRTSIVNCGWPLGTGQGTFIPLYIAVDPAAAIARGCKADF